MTRQNYINDINNELNEIEGKKDYWFHKMSEEQIYDKMKIKLWSGCRCLFDDIGILTAKDDFARLAAMCMIAMEAVDLKLNINKKGNKK